jgi:hypothetical protein
MMSLIAGNLGSVQRLLDDAGLDWGVCSGAAAYVYGSRRPIENVDILLAQGSLRRVKDLLEQNRRMAQYDGRILLWRGIKMFDDLTVKVAGNRYPFLMDEAMAERLRRRPLLGSRVLVLAPEDVLVHKSLLSLQKDVQRSNHQRDFDALVRIQGAGLDQDYLQQRIRLCQAEEQVRSLFEEAGLSLPS